MTVADTVVRILEQITREPEVRQNPDTRLYDLQVLDSLSTVELMLALSGEFGIEISPAEFEREQWATPRHIVQDIEARLGR